MFGSILGAALVALVPVTLSCSFVDPLDTDPDKYFPVFENTGTTETHVLIVELLEPRP